VIDIDSIRELATAYRYEQKLTGGVVLVFEDEVYGWKNALRDPGHEQPGSLAIDNEGWVFIAEGGSEYEGAFVWALHPQHLIKPV